MTAYGIEAGIEKALDYMKALPSSDLRRRFDCVEVWGDEFGGVSDWRAEDDVFLGGVRLSDIEDRSFDFCALGAGQVNDKRHPGEVTLVRVRTVSAKYARGRIIRLTPVVVEMSQVILSRSRIRSACRYFLGSSDGLKWSYISQPGQGVIWDERAQREDYPYLCFAPMYRATRDADWSVFVSESEDGASIRIPTDAVGVSELFHDRERDTGRRRRSALLHWVSSHYRKRRPSDPEATRFVRAHLRGSQKFEWHGLFCKVRPSDADSRLLTVGAS